MPKKTRKEFDEVELLLNVVSDYKIKKSTESIDWESVKSKYTLCEMRCMSSACNVHKTCKNRDIICMHVSINLPMY